MWIAPTIFVDHLGKRRKEEREKYSNESSFAKSGNHLRTFMNTSSGLNQVFPHPKPG